MTRSSRVRQIHEMSVFDTCSKYELRVTLVKFLRNCYLCSVNNVLKDYEAKEAFLQKIIY